MKVIIFILLLAISVAAQTTRADVVYVTGVPSNCLAGRVYINRTTGFLYTYKVGVGCFFSGVASVDGSGAANRVSFWSDADTLSSNAGFTFSSNNLSIPAGGAFQINGSNFAFSNLAGNIAVSQMNSGTSASSSTFWRGDGTWATPAGGVTANTTTGVFPYLSASSVFSDSPLIRRDASSLDFRNGTNAVIFRAYSTYTNDASNRGIALIGNFGGSNNPGLVGFINNGTGGSAQLWIMGSEIIFGRSASDDARINTSGHFIPASTNARTLGSTSNRWSTGYFGTAIDVNVATGTAPLVIASTTPVNNLTSHPTTYNASGTQQTNAKVVIGSTTLVDAEAIVTFSGSAAFTSSSSYVCTATDKMLAQPLFIIQSSGSQIIIGGTSDSDVSFICVGN